MPTPEQLAADAAAEVPEATAGLNVLVQRLAELKAQLDALDAHRDEIRKDYDDLRKRVLPQALADGGLTIVRSPLGTVSLRSKSYARVPKTREAEARAWCMATDHDYLLTITPDAVKGLLNSLVVDGNPVPGFITVFTEETAVLTRKKE